MNKIELYLDIYKSFLLSKELNELEFFKEDYEEGQVVVVNVSELVI